MPGSELAWAGVYVPRSAGEPIFSEQIALDAVRNLVFEEAVPADFPLKDLAFDKATFDRLRARHALFDATNPDLTAFAGRGGKLMLWHGWADPHISPLNTIAYHEAVSRFMGAERAAAFERLYLLPGVHHCAGGEGPSAIDLLTPMMAWVERGVAPQTVTARPPTPQQLATGFGLPTAPAPQPLGAGIAAPSPAVTRTLDIAPTPAGSALGASVPSWMSEDFYRPYPPRTR